MTIFTSAIGIGAILLSILGLVLCLAGIVGVWMVKSRIEAVGKAAFVAANEAFALVDATFVRVKEVSDKCRQRFSGIISVAAERVKNAEADVSKAGESLLQSLDAVFQELKNAESWLDSSRSIAKGISRVSETAMSSNYAATHEDSVGVAITKRVQEFSQLVAEVIAKLQVVRGELVDLHDTGKLAREVVVRGVAWVADLDGRLANISLRIEEFHNKVTQTKASVDSLRQKLHWRIALVTVALTALLAWFGISQIGMMRHGGRFMQDQRAAETAR